MTSEELLDKPIAELLAMSDDELTAYVADLIPQARAEFVGREVTDSVLMPSGKRVSKRQIEKDNETMKNILRMSGIQL